MASATPDLRLPSQPQGIIIIIIIISLLKITAHWLVPNYTAWWQRHMCVNNLPRVALHSRAAGIQTHDRLIASPAPYRYATEPCTAGQLENELNLWHVRCKFYWEVGRIPRCYNTTRRQSYKDSNTRMLSNEEPCLHLRLAAGGWLQSWAEVELYLDIPGEMLPVMLTCRSSWRPPAQMHTSIQLSHLFSIKLVKQWHYV